MYTIFEAFITFQDKVPIETTWQTDSKYSAREIIEDIEFSLDNCGWPCYLYGFSEDKLSGQTLANIQLR